MSGTILQPHRLIWRAHKNLAVFVIQCEDLSQIVSFSIAPFTKVVYHRKTASFGTMKFIIACRSM